MPVPPDKLVDTCIRLELAALLKAEGYKKKARNFRLATEESTRIVNVQASQWNFQGRAQFVMNLGVFFPAVHRLEKDWPIVGSPKEYECQAQMRLGPPGKADNAWWEIRGEADIPKAAAEMAERWKTRGRPWMAERATIAGALRFESETFLRSITRAVMLFVLGDLDGARRHLSRVARESDVEDVRKDALECRHRTQRAALSSA